MNRPMISPDRIVSITDYSDDTLRNLVAHLDVSDRFEHYIYRESELDELLRLVLLTLESGTAREQQDQLLSLFSAARAAHDLIGDEKPREAADRLRQVL